MIVPVTITVGAAADATTAAPVSGTLAVQRFARAETGVAAVGTLTVSVPETASSVARTIVTQVALPLARSGSDAAAADTPVGQAPAVAAAAAECGTLNLALGAVDVEALGLPIHIERTAVDVTAVDGSGNQLGTLLCQIAALLDSDTSSTQLVAALNRLLDLLG
ncbi:MAG TPA: hypothetical protein VFJ02_22845 [Vicinamibacterales bacterium]|nr:hypothetical protein [Vicinamibacterales bacterium]